MAKGKGKKKGSPPNWSPADLLAKRFRKYVEDNGTTGAFAGREARRTLDIINRNRAESGKEQV